MPQSLLGSRCHKSRFWLRRIHPSSCCTAKRPCANHGSQADFGSLLIWRVDTMSNANLFVHVADIVSAHVSNNAVAANDLPNLIRAVHSSLATLGKSEPVEEKRMPAVSIRSSVKPDALTCLECGTKTQLLRRHLMGVHHLLPEQYIARWGLPADYPMVAPDYSERRKLLAVAIGLGRLSARARRTESSSAEPSAIQLSAGTDEMSPVSPPRRDPQQASEA